MFGLVVKGVVVEPSSAVDCRKEDPGGLCGGNGTSSGMTKTKEYLAIKHKPTLAFNLNYIFTVLNWI